MRKHTDVPSWSGSTALLQLQSTRRCDDRAGDGTRSRLMTAHPPILEYSKPLLKLSSRCWCYRNIPSTGRPRQARLMLHLWCEIEVVRVENLKFTQLRHGCSIEPASICDVLTEPRRGTSMFGFQIQLPLFSALCLDFAFV